MEGNELKVSSEGYPPSVRISINGVTMTVKLSIGQMIGYSKNPGLDSFFLAIHDVLREGNTDIKWMLSAMSVLPDGFIILGLGNTTPVSEVRDWAKQLLSQFYS
jgi:hypothetical protein